MDTRTVTTPDVITAFAVPNPNCPSQDQSVFSGLAAFRVAPAGLSPSLLRISNVLFSLTLSTVDASQGNTLPSIVNARKWCSQKLFAVDIVLRNSLQIQALLTRNKIHTRFPQ